MQELQRGRDAESDKEALSEREAEPLSTIEERWPKLVALKPRYQGVVTAVKEGDNTLYLLSKKFGTFSIHKIIKDLVEMGVLESHAEESGRRKKVYSLTPLGRKLL